MAKLLTWQTWMTPNKFKQLTKKKCRLYSCEHCTLCTSSTFDIMYSCCQIVCLCVFSYFIDHKIGHLGICLLPMMELVKKKKQLKVTLLLHYLETLWNDSDGHIYKLWSNLHVSFGTFSFTDNNLLVYLSDVSLHISYTPIFCFAFTYMCVPLLNIKFWILFQLSNTNLLFGCHTILFHRN